MATSTWPSRLTDPSRLVEEGEAFARQRPQGRPLDFANTLPTCCSRGAVNPRVGDGLVPSAPDADSALERLEELCAFQAVALHVAHAALDLSLVPRRVRLGRQDDVP